MRVSLDGGVTWVDSEKDGVQINFEVESDVFPKGSIILNFTDEGMVADLFSDESTDETCLDTKVVPYDEMVGFLFKRCW